MDPKQNLKIEVIKVLDTPCFIQLLCSAFPAGLLHTFIKLRTLHQEVHTLHHRVNEQVPLADVMSNLSTGLSGKLRLHRGQSGNLRKLLWSLVPLVVQVLTAGPLWLLVFLQGSRACSWR